MTVNGIFDNVKIYDVQSRLDVVMNESFLLEVLDGPEDLLVLTSKDPRLEMAEDDRGVKATKLGEALIRFMSGATIVKDLWINVVSSTGPNATTLGGTLGEPVPK